MLLIPEEELYLRQKLAISLGDLSECIILEKPPFDSFPKHDEVLFHGGKLSKYKEELEEQFKEDLYSAAITLSRWRFEQKLTGHSLGSFSEIYPRDSAILKRFEKWVWEREGPPELITLGPDKLRGCKVNQEIKTIIKERLTAYSLDRKYRYASPADVSFSRTLDNGQKLFIVVDKGVNSRTMSFCFALEKPDVPIDVAELFGGAQSRYDYDSPESLEFAVNRGLDLVIELEEHFIKAVEGAIA